MPVALPLAIVGSAAIGAAASSSAASKAAKAETNAANQATQVQQDHYNQVRQDLMPYNTAGQNALTGANTYLNGYGASNAGTSANALNNLVTGAGGSQQAALAQTPGYQFTLSQGLKAAQNSAAARGLGVSGAALKGAANYSTGLANSTYGDQVNRLVQNAQLQNQAFNDQYNRYMSQAQLGEAAAAQTGTLGVQTGASIGNNLTSAGNAKAAGQIASGNAIGNFANSVPNALLYNNLFGGSSGGGGMYSTAMPSPLQYTPMMGY
jgi:hypothetical protein